MACCDPEVKAIERWFNPLMDAIGDVPDDSMLHLISWVAAEAKKRGVLDEAGWKAIVHARWKADGVEGVFLEVK